jgi:hypothetical protein
MSPLGGSYGISTRGDVSMRFTNLYFRAESTNQVIAQIGVQGSDLGIFELKNSGTTHTRFRSSNSFLESSFIIGDSTTPTAKFQVKGSGSTSATTNLLLQNASGSDLLKVYDGGDIFCTSKFNIERSSGKVFTVSDSSGELALIFSATAGDGRLQIYNDGNYSVDYINVSSYNGSLGDIFKINSNGNVGIGTTSPTAKTHIVGTGSTSSTTNLLLQNSSGTDLFKVDDSGNIYIGETRPLEIWHEHMTNQTRLKSNSFTLEYEAPVVHRFFSKIQVWSEGNLGFYDNYGAVMIGQTSSARAHLYFESGGAAVTPTKDGQMWWDGTNLKFYDGTTTHNIV